MQSQSQSQSLTACCKKKFKKIPHQTIQLLEIVCRPWYIRTKFMSTKYNNFIFYLAQQQRQLWYHQSSVGHERKSTFIIYSEPHNPNPSIHLWRKRKKKSRPLENWPSQNIAPKCPAQKLLLYNQEDITEDETKKTSTHNNQKHSQ